MLNCQSQVTSYYENVSRVSQHLRLPQIARILSKVSIVGQTDWWSSLTNQFSDQLNSDKPQVALSCNSMPLSQIDPKDVDQDVQ